jgi:hypothetical protein
VPTVVMMPKKRKTARPTSKKASGKAPYKRRQPSHLPLTNELLIDAGYTYPEQRIDELLELAGADTNPQSRRDFVNVLQLAQMAWEDEKKHILPTTALAKTDSTTGSKHRKDAHAP